MSGLSASAFKKFKQNYFGIASLCFVILVGFMAIFAYVFAPDDSQYANQMQLSIHSKSPGFEVSLLIQPNASPKSQSLIAKLFFGDKYPAREIPILIYQIQQQ